MTIAVRSGQLRHPIRLQRAVEARSSSGMVTHSWTDLEANWRAAIEPMTLRSQERIVGDSKLQDITHVVRIRARTGLRAKDRIAWTDRGTERILEISSVADILEHGRLQELLCREVT